MATGRISNLPRSTRRYSFALTPLADAMFQLLIFFMLTSSLTPYSLLTLQSGPGSAAATAQTQSSPQSPQTAPVQSAIWQIENGGIIASGQRFDFEQLSQLANALIAAGTPQVVLVSTPSAQVQDLANVLEKLTAAGIGQIQIVGQTAQGGSQ